MLQDKLAALAAKSYGGLALLTSLDASRSGPGEPDKADSCEVDRL